MIPPARAFIDAVRFVARRRRAPMPEDAVLTALLADAEDLAAGIADEEPAAMFFAVASRPRELVGIWATLSRTVAANQAGAVGLQLRASEDELRELRLAVVAGHAHFAEVREWFASRLEPRK